jgi:hypothetical protein
VRLFSPTRATSAWFLIGSGLLFQFGDDGGEESFQAFDRAEAEIELVLILFLNDIDVHTSAHVRIGCVNEGMPEDMLIDNPGLGQIGAGSGAQIDDGVFELAFANTAATFVTFAARPSSWSGFRESEWELGTHELMDNAGRMEVQIGWRAFKELQQNRGLAPGG